MISTRPLLPSHPLRIQLDQLVGAGLDGPGVAAGVDRVDREGPGAATPFEELVVRVDSSFAPMSEGVRRTSEQATSTLQKLEGTLEEMGSTLTGVGEVIEPESPLLVRFERAMIDLSEASRALRELADYLERNPSSLVRGRPGGEG